MVGIPQGVHREAYTPWWGIPRVCTGCIYQGGYTQGVKGEIPLCATRPPRGGLPVSLLASTSAVPLIHPFHCWLMLQPLLHPFHCWAR